MLQPIDFRRVTRLPNRGKLLFARRYTGFWYSHCKPHIPRAIAGYLSRQCPQLPPPVPEVPLGTPGWTSGRSRYSPTVLLLICTVGCAIHTYQYPYILWLGRKVPAAATGYYDLCSRSTLLWSRQTIGTLARINTGGNGRKVTLVAGILQRVAGSTLSNTR